MRFRLFVLGLMALLAAGCSVIDLMSGRMAPLPVGGELAVEDFAIVDPYDVPGFWAKAQLHVHTDASIDGKLPIEAALHAYASRGYDFVAITDHDSVTLPKAVPDSLTVITGEEHTLPQPFYPIGQHVIFLFVDRHVANGSIDEKLRDVEAQGGLSIVAHPSWKGFGGYGEWRLWQLESLSTFHMMEISNPHSDPDLDAALWHEVVRRRGPRQPVWAVAVDDAHDAAGVGRAWTMVKVEGRDPAHLRSALARGSHYATTGIEADFGVDGDGAIWARSSEPAEITFIGASGDILSQKRNVFEARYLPGGSERFIRIEIRGSDRGRRAWSQPFWLVEEGM